MNKKRSRLTKAILETAEDMLNAEVIDKKAYEKITMRHLEKEERSKMDLMTGDEIRSLREEEHLSQAVFANYLNLTVGYISQLERGIKRPKGATLALLNVIRHKGLDAILW